MNGRAFWLPTVPFRLAGPALVLTLVVSMSCGGSTPAAPSPAAPAPTSAALTGTTRDAGSGAALAAVTVRIEGLGEVVSDATGRFQIGAPGPSQTRVVVVSSPLVVTRETRLVAPGPDASIALIPASYDLATFDQLFRYGPTGLHRWTSTPALAIIERVLRFTNVADAEYVATSGTLADADVQSLLRDLVWGLPRVTGDTCGAFTSTTRQMPAEGDRVQVRRNGAIVVARYEGLQDATGYWGYGRWATDASGAVVSGIVMLDARFDASSTGYTCSLRVHELGHALGYGHVMARTSFMNASAVVLPTEFDIGAARLAFQRPPGNRSPDVDPPPFTANVNTGQVSWSGLP
jgi:hypothetical protein